MIVSSPFRDVQFKNVLFSGESAVIIPTHLSLVLSSDQPTNSLSLSLYLSEMSKKRVLIVGGTGYLGQHLLQSFAHNPDADSPFSLAFTHNSTAPHALLNAIPHALPFRLDLRTCDGLNAISDAFGKVLISPIHTIF